MTKKSTSNGEKVCTGCWEPLPMDSFHRRTESPDGHYSQCKDCRGEYQKAYYHQNKGKIGKRIKSRKQNKIRQAADRANSSERAAQMRREDDRQDVRQIGPLDYFKGMGLAEISVSGMISRDDWLQVGARYPGGYGSKGPE